MACSGRAAPAGPLRRGGFGANGPSGNGWVLEVLVDLLPFARSRDWPEVGRYEVALIEGVRWLLQSQYTLAGGFLVPNPERARGGVFRREQDLLVRTDAVSHGTVGLIGALSLPGDRLVLELDEQLWSDLPVDSMLPRADVLRDY